MATNPPVTIGEITTVPAPGSGVTSAYHQTITRRTIHRFATVAARDAAYPAAAAGAGAFSLTLDTLTVWVVNAAGTAWVLLTAPPTVWTAPTFQNGWINSGGAIRTARYRKIGDMVYLEGTIKSGTLNTIAFNLPAGFRPPQQLGFSTTAGGQVAITTGGDLYPQTGNVSGFDINFGFSITP